VGVEQVAEALDTDLERGLDPGEAAQRLALHGPNELVERAPVNPVAVLVRQFTSAMIIVLLAAAGITALIGHLQDTVVILAIVVLNGLIGFSQEYRAERAMDALRRMAAPMARVVRGGEIMPVPGPEVVPGDVVHLEAGDVVTADARLVTARALRINEAALTGESEPAEKVTEALPAVTAALLADQRNLVFRGTAVTYGRGVAVVVATGMETALGRVAEMIQAHAGERTPLQQRLARLGGQLAVLAIVVCILIFTVGMARGETLETMFLTAVSLAVAAIPEGLPAVITVALALGARRMAQRRALIRKLPAVETLGSVSVICSDKTGTLTENRMVVERVWTPTGEYHASGRGYAPEGEVRRAGDGGARSGSSQGTGGADGAGDRAADNDAASLVVEDEALAALARVAAVCNDATLRAPARAGDDWDITGDPTEAALLSLSGKLGVSRRAVLERHQRIEELTFESARRRMTTFHTDGAGVWVAVKGAPEAIAGLVDPGQAGAVREALRTAERYAAEGYRVLALAERRLERMPDPLESGERNLRLLGLVAMADPPRAAALDAIAACRSAGITPVMITGDHPLTALAIARRIGILEEGTNALTGAELEQMDGPAFDAAVSRIRVYARTNPEQKVRIVDAWRRRGAIVAMTGDGVNDAPALRLADIGVAMGITGTEVSKEAADMVLADDDFATIIAAVREGRRIYGNIRRFLRYLLTTNSAEVWVMAAAPFLGLPLPLIAVQILWINLVTDGLPALALGVEPAHAGAMRSPPRSRTESILGAGLWQQAVVLGALMAIVTLGLQSVAIQAGWAWQTMVFTTLALMQLGHALAVRSDRESFFRLGWRTNPALAAAVLAMAVAQLALVYVPALHPVFSTTSLGPVELALVLLASTTAFVAVELDKWVGRHRSTRPSSGARAPSAAAAGNASSG
jgi:P-type Ca2+ transporter type 2C